MIKLIPIFSFFLLVLPLSNHAQDVTTLLAEARQQEANFKGSEALRTYQLVLKNQPANIVALCKCSELCSLIGKRQATKEQQKEYYKDARLYAQKALQAAPENAEANFVMSMAMGRLALVSSGEEKIKAVKLVKYYAEKSVRLDPGDFKAYHILGKWNYEVSRLNAFERWLVKVMYDALPAASMDNAARYYEKSRQLNPGFILNYLELAKVYREKGEYKKAIQYLHMALSLPDKTEDDPEIKKEAAALLKELE